MSLSQALDDIAALTATVQDLQNQLNTVQNYCNECPQCGQDEPNLHTFYICTHCGYNRNRECVALCKMCRFRNVPVTTDLTRKECENCHIAYKLTEYVDDSNQCKQCDIPYNIRYVL